MTEAPAAPPLAEEAGSADADDAPIPAPPLSGADLLALSAEQAAARWASLDDAALDAEVASHRAALEGVRAELAGLGRIVSLEDGQTGTIAGIEVRGVGRGRGRTKRQGAGGDIVGAPFLTYSTSPPTHHFLTVHSPGRRGRGLPLRLRRRPGPVRVAGACSGLDARTPALSLKLVNAHSPIIIPPIHFPSHFQVPPHCIPVHANVTTYDWSRLAAATPGGFDVIMMDPPWQLATANPTRGVALGYSQLTDADITALPIPALQANGFLFIWVINAKYKFALDLFASWGYE